MIEEYYVSFETAKILKEKGFDEPVMYHFTPDGAQRKFQQAFYKDDVAQPTLQMAIKWIRETYNIHIVPFFDKLQNSDDLPYSFTLYLVSEYCATIEKTACFDINENYYWKYPEQSCEAAIKYCLENLI